MVVVFDNNVLISAALNCDSTLGKALLKARKNEYTIIASNLTIAELRITLLKQKFDKYLSLVNRIDFCETFAKDAKIITPKHKILACRDPKDNKFLELALSGKADLIISGDKDLLVLNPFRGIPIISASEFLLNY